MEQLRKLPIGIQTSRTLSLWEEHWGSDAAECTLSARFSGVIRRACEHTGKPVVVLVDEYDKPLLQALLNAPPFG